MKLKFTFISLEEPWTGGKANATYYKANILIEKKLCVVECSEKGYAELKSAKPAVEVEGNFDIKPSFERKAPVLAFTGL